MSKLTCVDIEKLMGCFTLLEQTICRKIGENNMLEARLDDAQRTLKFSLIKERSLMEERDGILVTVNTVQETLQQQYNLRDVNDILKDRMAEMKRHNERRMAEKDGELQKLLNVMEEEEGRHQRALETVKQQCQREIQDILKQLETKDAELARLLEGKEAELQRMKDTLKNQEKETQNQLLKLRMEFGATLAKVQNSAQRSQQQTQQNPSAAHLNIFKRKLHFMQEEKDREIMALRQRVQALEAQQQQQRTSGSTDGHLKRRRM
ncbi:unnamed protein product [Gadus morhua 'NCC']